MTDMKIIYRGNGFEITKRELMAAIIIIAITFAAGFTIAEAIQSKIDEKNREFNQAMRITADRELFEYGMKTDAGNAFVYGELRAIDAVTVPEIDGEYSYIQIREEQYTMHVRIVTRRGPNGQTYTTTETYWTWDEVGREEIACSRISFLGHEFEYGQINFPAEKYIDTVKQSSHKRHVYYACEKEYEGTIYAKLENNTVTDARFIEGRTPDEAADYLCKSGERAIMLCWILVAVLAIGVAFAFCTRDND